MLKALTLALAAAATLLVGGCSLVDGDDYYRLEGRHDRGHHRGYYNHRHYYDNSYRRHPGHHYYDYRYRRY